MAKNVVEISLVDGISKGLLSINEGVNGVGASFVKLDAIIGVVEKGFDLVSGAARGLADLVQPAADFEDALAKVQAQSGATAEEMEGLKKAAKAATETTRFTALEAAEALRVMAEDGIGAKDSMEQVSTVLAFAQANAQSAAEAAAGLGGVLDGFGEPAEKIGQLADSLSSVARAAGTSTKALQEGLAGVGAQATAANVSIEDSAAALGVFASAGKDGAAATALLGRLVTELNDPAKKAGAAIRDLGLSTSDFSGLINNLRQNSDAAGNVLEGLSTRGRLALGILLREGGASLDEMVDKYRNFAGASQAAADAAGNSFNGAIDKLTNAFEQAKITLFEPLLEPLSKEIDLLAKQIFEFTKTEEFAKLAQGIKEFTVDAVKSIREFLSEFDFQAALVSIRQFVDGANQLFGDLNSAINVAASAAQYLKLATSLLLDSTNALGAGIGPQIPKVALLSDALRGAATAASDHANATDVQSKAVSEAAKKFAEMTFAADLAKGAIAGVSSESDKSGAAIGDLSGKFDDLGKGIGTTTTLAQFFAKANQDLSGEFSDLAAGVGTAANVVGGLFSQAAKEAATDAESLAEKINSVASAVEETAPLVLLNFKAMADGSKESLQELQTALALAFSSKKSLEEAALLRDGLAKAFEAIGLDVAALDDAFNQFKENLASNDRAEKFSASLREIDKAVLGLLTNTKGAQEQINAVLSELFKGETAANAKLLQEQVSAYMLSMGASIETVDRAMKGFSDSVKTAALDEQFKLLKIESERSLGAAAKSAEAAFAAIVAGARDGTATMGDVRAAFIAYAKTQLDAVKNADEFKRSQVEASLASKAAASGLSESLVEMGIVGKAAGEKVAAGVRAIKPSADDAASSVQGVSNALNNAGNAANSATTAFNGNSSALITNANAAEENAFFIGEMSDALAKQLAGAAGNVQETARLTGEIYRQRDAASDRIAQIEKEIALYDPLQKQLEAVKNKYRGIGDEQARALAAQEQRLADLRDRANGGAGGGAGTQTGGGTTNVIGGAAPGQTPIVVNLALSALDPASLDQSTLTDLARQLTRPLRSIIASAG